MLLVANRFPSFWTSVEFEYLVPGLVVVRERTMIKITIAIATNNTMLVLADGVFMVVYSLDKKS